MVRLSSKLRELSERLGITNAEAAKRCGLDPRRYGHYVTGERRPNYETLLRICNALGTTPNLMLEYSDGLDRPEIAELVAVCSKLDLDQVRFLVAAADTLTNRAAPKS